MNHANKTQLLLAVSAIAVLPVPGIVFAQDFKFEAAIKEPLVSCGIGGVRGARLRFGLVSLMKIPG